MRPLLTWTGLELMTQVAQNAIYSRTTQELLPILMLFPSQLVTWQRHSSNPFSLVCDFHETASPRLKTTCHYSFTLNHQVSLSSTLGNDFKDFQSFQYISTQYQ